MGSDIGRITAMTAALLINSVNAAVINAINAKANHALSVLGMKVLAIHSVVCVWCSALPIAMAPPYMRATPQFT